MKFAPNSKRAFSLIEVLVVISIIALLLAMILPSFNRARSQSKSVICATNLHTLAQAWNVYGDDNKDHLLPARLPKYQDGGFRNPANHYKITTGLKYRPRWPALMQGQVGVPALPTPRVNRDRENYANPVYVCPSVSEWKDERNSAYGYNYQFLGSPRERGDQFRNLPVIGTNIRATAKTVVMGDCMGSAAAFPVRERWEYSNSERDEQRYGNYGWLLDPPRLMPGSSRAGGPGSKRSGPDPRHREKANMAFADGHAEGMSLKDLGYGVKSNGQMVDEGMGSTNKLFSGNGEDHAPP